MDGPEPQTSLADVVQQSGTSGFAVTGARHQYSTSDVESMPLIGCALLPEQDGLATSEQATDFGLLAGR
jgi:hypothetical protein